MYRLMLVEDETIIRRGIRNGFDWQGLGFNVAYEAGNGKKALEQLDALPEDELPDIILLDIQMPVMNGVELMHHLAERYPSIKVVVLSGYSEFEYAQQALNFGAVGYLLKPTQKSEIAEMFEKVRALLDDLHKQPSESVPLRVDPVTEKIRNYMEEHYCEKISLETLAEYLYMNPTYLSTLFKQKMGESFKNYLISLRVEKAKHLLLETDLKIYTVAKLVGYEDFRYFSKMFKNITGMTTLEYRSQKDG